MGRAMNLRVPYSDFVRELRQRLPLAEVYLERSGMAVILTAGDVAAGFTLLSLAPVPLSEVQEMLTSEGLSFRPGRWFVPDGATQILPHVVAISYRSGEDKPGLWVEAYPYKPTPGHALGRLFDELTSDGYLENSSLDDFIRLAEPNVVILDPEELSTFMAAFSETLLQSAVLFDRD
jgi:hypothetical protein